MLTRLYYQFIVPPIVLGWIHTCRYHNTLTSGHVDRMVGYNTFGREEKLVTYISGEI